MVVVFIYKFINNNICMFWFVGLFASVYDPLILFREVRC